MTVYYSTYSLTLKIQTSHIEDLECIPCDSSETLKRKLSNPTNRNVLTSIAYKKYITFLYRKTSPCSKYQYRLTPYFIKRKIDPSRFRR